MACNPPSARETRARAGCAQRDRVARMSPDAQDHYADEAAEIAAEARAEELADWASHEASK